MKKVWLAILLAFVMLFAAAACDGGSQSETPPDDKPPVVDPDPGTDPGGEETSLLLSADYIVLGVGGTKQLTLQKDGQDVAAASVTWSVSGSAVTVEEGLVTGVAVGECTVTAAYEGEQAAATVVVAPIRNLTVSESRVVLTTGDTAKLEAAVSELKDGAAVPAQAEVTYTSGDPAVVTVDENGNLAGVGSGITYVLVESGELSCAVAVNVCEAIATASEFREKIIADSDGTFLITQDLDFTGIQYFAIPAFSGTLFGGGHKLLNLLLVNHTVSPGLNYGGALFEEMAGTVCDLYIDATYEQVERETDGELQQGIQAYGGTVANFLRGTVENVYISVDFQIYPWWGTNWNEAGGVCGRLRGNAVIRNCIVEYSCATESSTLGTGRADIHSLYGLTDEETGSPRIDNVYILNSGSYKKDYRNTGSGFFGPVQPAFNGVYEFEDTAALLAAVQGTDMETVYGYAHTQPQP